MTWNEYNQRVWRLAGLTDIQIAAALAQNEKDMPPGWGEQQAVLAPGKTEESAIAAGVRAFHFYRQLPRQSKLDIQASLDAVIERENRMN
jgi:hypothetical protein